MSTSPLTTSPSNEPTWDIAHLFPAQGDWSEEEYLELPGNRLIEFSHGLVEVLPMPSDSHQAMVAFLYAALHAFTAPRALGAVRFAPLRLRLWPGKFREPDLLFLRADRDELRHERYWDGADLVMEVVSPNSDDRQRDLVVKRGEYARAGIAEYWMVDPVERRITVLCRQPDRDGYAVHGEFAAGEVATSTLLDGFHVEVERVLDAR